MTGQLARAGELRDNNAKAESRPAGGVTLGLLAPAVFPRALAGAGAGFSSVLLL